MFDIGWSEILVIVMVTILVVGPKELPKMLRGFGKTMGMVRRTANDFKRQFDDALREAERQADLGETKKQVQSIVRTDPLADVKKDLNATMRAANQPAKAKKPVASADPAPEAASAAPHEAEPLKTGAPASPLASPQASPPANAPVSPPASPAASQSGSDAA